MAITAFSQVGPLLSVSATVEDLIVSGATLGGVLVVSAHSVFAERYVRIDGDASTVPAAMIALGFSAYSNEVQGVRRLFAARVPITYVLLGRRTPADPTWEAACDAIKVKLDEAHEIVAHVLYAGRVESQQRELASYCYFNTAGVWLFHFNTASVDVRNNVNGNLVRLIQDDGALCNAISYDAATESSAAAPVVVTEDETFSLVGPDDTVLTITLAMSVQQDTDDVEAPSVATFTAARAQITSGAEPYNLEPAQVLTTGIDGLGPFVATVTATAAVLLSANNQPFNLTDGWQVEYIIDDVAFIVPVAAVNYGGTPNVATAAQVAAEAMLSAPLAAVATVAAVGTQVRITTVRRGSTASISIGPNTTAGWVTALAFPVAGATGTGNVGNVDAVTATEMVSMISAASGLTYATVQAGAVRFRSLIAGTDAEVSIAGTAGLLTAMGLVAADTPGTGDAANAAAVTAAELLAVLAPLTPTTAQVDDHIEITGTLGIGALHSLYLVGPLADALGIAGTVFGAGIAEEWPDFSMVGARAGLSLDAAPPDAGHLTWNNISVPGAYGSRTLSNAALQRLNREQNVNTFALINPSRGPEFHDGRLTISFPSGSPTYIDQWVATKWLADYAANVLATRLNALSDGNDGLGYFSEAAYAPFLISGLRDIQQVAVNSRCLAFVDVSQPTASKPTGVVVVPKKSLAPSLQQLRYAQVNMFVQLAAALHGLLVRITLNT